MTEGYQFENVLGVRARQYQKHRAIEIIRTTNNPQVVQRLVRDMSPEDRAYWLDHFQKRMAEREKPQTGPVKERVLVRKKEPASGRETYRLEEVEFDFKPRIN